MTEVPKSEFIAEANLVFLSFHISSALPQLSLQSILNRIAGFSASSDMLEPIVLVTLLEKQVFLAWCFCFSFALNFCHRYLHSLTYAISIGD